MHTTLLAKLVDKLNVKLHQYSFETVHTAKTTDKFSKMRPKISDDELKAPHMLMRPSVAAGRNGVNKVRSGRFLKCMLKPQMARTAEILTMAGLSAERPVTVASTKRVMAGTDICPGNLLPVQRHRPNKNGQTKKTARFLRETQTSKNMNFWHPPGFAMSAKTTFSKNPAMSKSTLPALIWRSITSYKRNFMALFFLIRKYVKITCVDPRASMAAS